MKKASILSLIVFFVISGCTPYNHYYKLDKQYLARRQLETKQYDTSDKTLVLRAVISTMQDLGFIIETADEKLGIISGTSYTNTKTSKLNVFVHKTNDKQIVVRANAQVGLKALDNPIPYQNFFNALGQSLFLEAHEVE